MIKEIFKEIKSHQAQFWEILTAFVVTIVGCVLLTMDILVYKSNGSKQFIAGTAVFFGAKDFPLNGFIGFLRLFIFALPILGLLLVCTSYFIKPLKGMGSLFLMCSAVLVLCVPYFIDQNGDIYGGTLKLTIYGYVSMSFFIIGAVLLFMSEYTDEIYSVGEIAETAMLLAMAVLFSYIKIYSSDFGSINLQIIPLALIAFRCKSSRTFLFCGVIYGLITCFLDGYGLYSYPLEYLIAFGSVCILSFCRKPLLNEGKPVVYGYFLIALLLGISTCIRYLCCVVDAVFFYGTTWSQAFVGAALPVFISGLFAIVVMEIFYTKPIFLINKMFPPADYKELTKTDVVVDTIEGDDTFK